MNNFNVKNKKKKSIPSVVSYQCTDGMYWARGHVVNADSLHGKEKINKTNTWPLYCLPEFLVLNFVLLSPLTRQFPFFNASSTSLHLFPLHWSLFLHIVSGFSPCLLIFFRFSPNFFPKPPSSQPQLLPLPISHLPFPILPFILLPSPPLFFFSLPSWPSSPYQGGRQHLTPFPSLPFPILPLCPLQEQKNGRKRTPRSRTSCTYLHTFIHTPFTGNNAL